MKKLLILTLALAIIFSSSLCGQNRRIPIPGSSLSGPLGPDLRIAIPGFDFGSGFFGTSLEERAGKCWEDYGEYYNQIVIGHSQGGLKGLGYIKKEKVKADEESRPSNIKAFISVDSPVRGFSGLDYGYDTMRYRVLDTIELHQKAVGSTLVAIPVVGFVGNILHFLSPSDSLNIFLWFANEFQLTDTVKMKGLITTLANKNSSAGDIQEITDMGRSSAYVSENIGPTTITKIKYQSGTTSYVTIRWDMTWLGFAVPVLVWQTDPVYSYYDQYNYSPNYRNDIPIGHIVGIDNDPIRLSSDADEPNVRIKKETINIGYYVAGGLNTCYGIATFPFGSSYFGYHAANCFAGGAWLDNYVSNWGNIIGGQSSDAFISVSSQTLPGTPLECVMQLSVDHVRSGSDTRIWGPDGQGGLDGSGGKIDELKRFLGL